jgi:hypothetical protein
MWLTLDAQSVFSEDDDDGASSSWPPSVLASKRTYITTDLLLALLHKLLRLHQDRARVKALVRDLLAQTTTAFFVGAPETISRCPPMSRRHSHVTIPRV